jgi:phosphonoacetaldehyde hydrolase
MGFGMHKSGSRSVIPAVFLDWAGTVVDHGSIAPVRALEAVFASAGLNIPPAVIRRDMGLAKKDHVRKLLQEIESVQQWNDLYGTKPTEADVDHLYEQLQPKMMEMLNIHSQVISGVPEIAAQLRARGVKLAGTTGYTRSMLDAIQRLATPQGYTTDASLAPEDVGAGRPYPWMCYQLAIDLRIYPLSACVKIGDTDSDMHEGRNAGMWTIGVTRSGNGSGLTEQEWATTGAEEQSLIMARAEEELTRAGAHYLAESVAHILPVLNEIEIRISRGERP